MKSIADFGCGKCEYINYLHDQGFDVMGFDLKLYSEPKPYIEKINLGEKIELKQSFEFIQALKVGNRLFSDQVDNFHSNLQKYSTKGVLLYWPKWGTEGYQMINNREEDLIKKDMQKFMFEIQDQWT